jgi:hypothetical protein
MLLVTRPDAGRMKPLSTFCMPSASSHSVTLAPAASSLLLLLPLPLLLPLVTLPADGLLSAVVTNAKGLVQLVSRACVLSRRRPEM